MEGRPHSHSSENNYGHANNDQRVWRGEGRTTPLAPSTDYLQRTTFAYNEARAAVAHLTRTLEAKMGEASDASGALDEKKAASIRQEGLVLIDRITELREEMKELERQILKEGGTTPDS